MYELLILWILVRHPAHGYLIAKIINDIIGPFAKLSNGRMYPLLNKMQEQGLIEADTDDEAVEQESGRPVNRYRITEAGRHRFRELMLDTTSNPGDYQRFFFIKSAGLYLLEPEERLRLIEHYMFYCEAHIRHQRGEADDLRRHIQDESYYNVNLDTVIPTMEHRIEMWEHELAWAKGLRDKEALAQALQD
jgi:DNA-binding PadR family transcriptional regulator